jgi:hypothetical protein
MKAILFQFRETRALGDLVSKKIILAESYKNY